MSDWFQTFNFNLIFTFPDDIISIYVECSDGYLSIKLSNDFGSRY